VTGRLLTWQRIHNKADTLELQTFACTTAWPRTPGGRRLRNHPREWEWAAQSHLRNLNRLMRPGDSALVGRDPERALSAAVHVAFQIDHGLLIATVKAAAVGNSYRRLEGRFVGDEVLEVAQEEAIRKASDVGASRTLLVGYIHRENRASMHMATRAGLEPRGVPTDEYQPWFREISDGG
jgi:hypothetical protein